MAFFFSITLASNIDISYNTKSGIAMAKTSYKRKILYRWPAGWNRVDTPCPEEAYRVGTNIRLRETFIPERRGGTAIRNTNGGCDLLATDQPVVAGMKYYPTGRTAQWVVAAGTDLYFSTDGTNFAAQSETLTEDAEVVFAVLPISAQGEDYLFMVNGSENRMYAPQTPAWSTIGASSPTGCSYAVEHANRLYLIKNADAYFSGIRANSWDQNNDVLNLPTGGNLSRLPPRSTAIS